MKINAKEVIEAVIKLIEGNNGTFYWKLGRHDGNIWAVVLGWSQGMDPKPGNKFIDDNGYGICMKLAYQPANSIMQCDYDVDWLMPYDEESGEVDDTDIILNSSYLKEDVMQKLLDELVIHYNESYA